MTGAPPPYAILAELTHRCPLHCLYCSNPVSLRDKGQELATGDWRRVLVEAAALGVVQAHFSGGEPLTRHDLETLVAQAHQLGIYTNLITSGLGFTLDRGLRLAAAGLNSVQLSIQGDQPRSSAAVAGAHAFTRKRQAARAILDAGLPLSMNVVLHRLNLGRLDSIIDLCVSWGADRLELANTQYYGWALLNRGHLLPSRAQVRAAEAVYQRRKQELAGRVELIWVIPDYYETSPKPCMGGWARTSLTVAPDGYAYPCPAASELAALTFPSVTEHGLAWIWRDSPAFNAYRGTGWMRDPCRSCPAREQDFGGCRCQAYALTGDATRADPVCVYSPDHHLVLAAVDQTGNGTADSATVLTSPGGSGTLPEPAYRRPG
jgi:PqqA peptide cyclase